MRNIITGIKNIIRWFPIIWRDRDWDHFFIFEILKFKLKNQADHTKNHGYHVSSERDAEVMMMCVCLIEKIQNESYLDELVNDDELTIEKVKEAEKKHNKAKQILFKTLEQNIERWWD